MTTTGANTISTKTYRDKYRLATFDQLLRNALIAEKICNVDRTGAKTIQSPYGSQPTVTVSGLTGTYAVDDYTTTDSTLTVADEFKVAEQVYDFEETLANFSLFANRTDEQAYAVAAKIDQFVLNMLIHSTEGGSGTYTTPVGGFTTAANINVILSNLISKVSGYSEMYKGMYLVIENTDMVGFIQAQATNGFSFADAALNNGFTGSYMGVDLYVARTGTFVTSTIGTRTFTNSGCRVFGIKNTATYAAPQGVKFEEKGVSGKTGMELVTYGYIGAKVWDSKDALTIKITIA
jgi:hypothetical protein